MTTIQTKHSLIFGFTSVFMVGLGLTLITPVVPSLVASYTTSPHQQAVAVSLLTSVYAFAMFLASPILGALSDRFGRRIVLISSLIGSSIGYLIFGLGGALWVLFLGRLIEGLTGGEISAIFAYFADITTEENRTKYFGWVSAVAGIGTAMGPLIGGVLSHFGSAVPLLMASLLTFINAVYGYFLMPESLNKTKRASKIFLGQLNPFKQLRSIFSITSLKWFMICGFFIWLPNGSLQAIFAQFSIDTFSLKPLAIGFTFSLMGIMDIFSQTFIMPLLLRYLKDQQILQLGISNEIIGYGLIFLSVFIPKVWIFILGMIFFGFGDSIFGPSFNGLLSKKAAARDQGKIQGGAQSIQALARVIGPIIGGQLYASIHHGLPALMGIFLLSYSLFLLKQKSHSNLTSYQR